MAKRTRGKKAQKTNEALRVFNELPETAKARWQVLNPRHRRFLLAYIGEAHFNATKAAIIAGYKPDSAMTYANWIIWRDDVRAALEVWFDAVAMGPAELTARIADMASASMDVFYTVSPTEGVKINPEGFKTHGRWIKAMQFDKDTGRLVRIEIHDAKASQALLARVLKLVSDQPIVNLYLALRQMSDDQLMSQVEQARKELRLVPAALSAGDHKIS